MNQLTVIKDALSVLFLVVLVAAWVSDRRRRKVVVKLVSQNQALAAELAAERVRVQELRSQIYRLQGDPWIDARG